jgi:hypothetical protein
MNKKGDFHMPDKDLRDPDAFRGLIAELQGDSQKPPLGSQSVQDILASALGNHPSEGSGKSPVKTLADLLMKEHKISKAIREEALKGPIQQKVLQTVFQLIDQKGIKPVEAATLVGFKISEAPLPTHPGEKVKGLVLQARQLMVSKWLARAFADLEHTKAQIAEFMGLHGKEAEVLNFMEKIKEAQEKFGLPNMGAALMFLNKVGKASHI